MTHLKRLIFGASVLTLIAVILTLMAASFWIIQVLSVTIFSNHLVQLGAVVFVLLPYCVGVMVELGT